jgi:hypothetical protein
MSVCAYTHTRSTLLSMRHSQLKTDGDDNNNIITIHSLFFSKIYWSIYI